MRDAVLLRLLCLGLFALVALPGRFADAAELGATEIVDRVLEHNAFGFENAIARVRLVLTSKRGNERRREIEIRSLERQKLNRTLVRFLSPADVAGTGFLVLENQERDDDQYLYLPALGKVKRISGNQRNQRFMGTDLTYADLESRSLRRANLTRLADAAVGGNPTYVIEAKPKEGSDSEYGRTVSWIHTVSFVPLKIEFYDQRGALLKTLLVKRLEKKDGRWVVMDSTVENVQAGTATQLTVDSIDFAAKLAESEFTERALAGG